MNPFRLALLNPNTDAGHTEAMAAVAGEALGDCGEIVALTASRGPASIESAADDVVAAGEVVEMLGRAGECDAYLVACFGDPGLHAARELTDRPVVGIGEAALHAAALVAGRFAIVTTLRRGIPDLEDMVDREGQAHRCAAILALEVPVSQQGAGHPSSTQAILAAGREAIEDHGADALVLACGAMADVAREVSETLRVPVCDGVAFGTMLAYGLWRCGLRTSKVGMFAAPEPIEYLGMRAPGAAA
jgi:allantoin racemase